MNHRDLAAGSIGVAAARIAGGVAAVGLIGTAIVGLQSAAASPTAATAPTAPAASRAVGTAMADVRVDWADIARPGSGSVRVPASVDSLPAGAVVSTELVALDGGSVSGLLFDPDRLTLTVDANAAAGRYGVTVHVLRGGAELARAYDEFAIR